MSEIYDQNGNLLPVEDHGDGTGTLTIPPGVTSIGPWPRLEGGRSYVMTVGGVDIHMPGADESGALRTDDE